MNWGQLLSHIWGYLVAHAGTDEFVAWSILTAIIVNMPVPGSPLTRRTMYEWLYNSLHQFANTGKMQRPMQPAPTLEPETKTK
jgi:hypothetical protein